MVDLEDPIEIDKEEIYLIVATNQGSADATGIRIACDIEDCYEYVSSAGATEGSFADGRLTFVPLPRLAPKAQATWRVTLKSTKAADTRFKVSMTSDQLTRPVEETEATNIYQ